MTLVYSEDKILAFELLAKAKDLGDDAIGVIIGKKDEKLADEYFSQGASKVFIAETELDQFKAEEYVDILAEVVKETKSETILIGSSKNG